MHGACGTDARPRTQLVEGKSAFTGRSHRTLLIFRRDVRQFPKAKEIELRHQRNPDVDICVVNSGEGACSTHAFLCAALPLTRQTPSHARRAPAHTRGGVRGYRDAAAWRLHARPGGSLPGAVGAR